MEARISTLQDIQTDSAQLVDIGMINLGQETDFGWCHWVVVR